MKYEGDLKEGKYHGQGTLTYSEHIYVSVDADGFETTKEENIADEFLKYFAVIYKGEWKNGLRHGKGTMTYGDSGVYDGEWKNDMRNGKGILSLH